MSVCGSDARQAKPYPSHQSTIQLQLGSSVSLQTHFRSAGYRKQTFEKHASTSISFFMEGCHSEPRTSPSHGPESLSQTFDRLDGLQLRQGTCQGQGFLGQEHGVHHVRATLAVEYLQYALLHLSCEDSMDAITAS